MSEEIAQKEEEGFKVDLARLGKSTREWLHSWVQLCKSPFKKRWGELVADIGKYPVAIAPIGILIQIHHASVETPLPGLVVWVALSLAAIGWNYYKGNLGD